jgi:hypothetical protein
VIPAFDPTTGALPPGDHRATLEEIGSRFGFTPRRRWLLKGLRAAVKAFWLAGIDDIFIDGSFCTALLLSYRFIGLAWIMHAAWDLAHHLWGNPIWPFMPASSWSCMIFDSLIALWFFAGAPSLWSTKLPNRVKA